MGWIKSGNIEFYSLSDTISEFVNRLFELLIAIMNPFFFMAITFFMISIIFYFIYAIKIKIENPIV